MLQFPLNFEFARKSGRKLYGMDGLCFLPQSGFVQQYAAADSQKRRDFFEAKIRATFACR